MDLSLARVKRLFPDSEYRVVHTVVRTGDLPEAEIQRLRSLVRGWRDKYVDRAHQQAREARGKKKPRSTRGAESNENTMRQADVLDWVLDRLTELEGQGAAEADAPSSSPPASSTPSSPTSLPSKEDVRSAIGEPHVSTFGDLWAEFPEAPVYHLRKLMWALVEEGEAELNTGGGVELTTEEEVAFVEEVHAIEGVPVKRRKEPRGRNLKKHQDRLARTKVVRIRSHNRSRGARNQAKRDRR